MDKNIDKEIAEYETKIAEMKKGLEYQIHDFAKGNKIKEI